MRKVPFLILLFLSLPAWSTITYTNSVNAAAANTFTTGSIDTSGANFLVAVLTSAAGSSPTLSDNKGNTSWSCRTTYSEGGGCQVQICYFTNPAVGTGHTFTLTGSSIFATLNAYAFAGADTSSPYDNIENGTSGGAFDNTNTEPGSVTPNQTGDVLLSGLCFTAGNTISSVGSGFGGILQTNFSGGVNYGGAASYLIDTSASAINPLWNTTTTPFGGAVNIAGFKAGAGGGAAAPTFTIYRNGITR